MGIVYLAHDPTLERDVALKVIHPEGDSPPLRARLLREARALGKLSHPNVVTVHEAGTDEGRVFIVMDLISGGTLGEWLAERRRGLEEIVRVFEQAGRGLAAAHAAGLVHRDFKPANVLIAKDGTAHVTDFGLAALVAAPLDEPDDRSPDVKVGLTEAGALIGTPSYMAPEQHERRQAGPAADQFAFGVALYEALVGRRPYSGDTPPSCGRTSSSGQFRLCPPACRAGCVASSRAPSTAIRRERFPSMAALLAALGRGPLVTGRRLAVAAGIALAGVAVVATRDRPPACEGASFVASLWNEGAKQSVRRAFLASGRPYAEDTYQRLARAIDAYTAALGGERQETCEAMRAPGEQSQVLARSARGLPAAAARRPRGCPAHLCPRRRRHRGSCHPGGRRARRRRHLP
jgi:hypothetical protein